MSEPLVRYLSLGWGVQSWTIAAMVALGELPPVDVAVHADTTHEADATYRHAAKWTPWLEERGVGVVTVTAKRAELVREDWGTGSVMIPAFSLAPDGSHGQIRRQCTHDWKLSPIRRYIRGLLLPGQPQPGAVECLQGISLDEWHRMRTSDVKYTVNRYPLVDLRMTRADCVNWLIRQGLDVPPKSACVFCPYHSKAHWRDKQLARQPDKKGRGITEQLPKEILARESDGRDGGGLTQPHNHLKIRPAYEHVPFSYPTMVGERLRGNGKPKDSKIGLSNGMPETQLANWRNGAQANGVGLGHAKGWQLAAEALGIDWMKREELTQAIPPAYTEFIGRQLLHAVAAKA